MRNYNELYGEMQGNHLALLYKGQVGFEQTNSLLKLMEVRLESCEPDARVKKKVYNVATECLQNLSYHLDDKTNPFGDNGFVTIEIMPDKYMIITGNHIYNSKITDIQARLDLVNSLTKEELRELYKKVLDNNEYTDKGTAGLGFIDIARKSDEKIQYSFAPLQDDVSFFTLKVEIWRGNPDYHLKTNHVIQPKIQMETLTIEKTDNTPYIHFEPQTGRMEIKGRSTVENPLNFYTPIIKWLEEYKSYTQQKTTLEIHLEYFNTSSSKCLLDVFKRFSAMSKNGTPVEVNWWCEEIDDEMREAGQDYQDLVGLPFNILTLS